MGKLGWIILILFLIGIGTGIYFGAKTGFFKTIFIGKPIQKKSSFLLKCQDEETNKQIDCTFILEQNNNEILRGNLSKYGLLEVTVLSGQNYTLITQAENFYTKNKTVLNKSNSNQTFPSKMNPFGNISINYSGFIGSEETEILVQINVQGIIKQPLICISRTTEILKANIITIGNSTERKIPTRLLDFVDSCVYLKDFSSSNESANYPVDLQNEHILKKIKVIPKIDCEGKEVSSEHIQVWVVDTNLIKKDVWTLDYENIALEDVAIPDKKYKIYGCVENK